MAKLTPSPILTTFAFRSSEVWRLSLDLDPYGGNVMAPRLSAMFRGLVRWQFPCLPETGQCHHNSERSPSSSVTNYRPISITSVLSKVFERQVSVRFGRLMERSGVLPTAQFAYRKGLGTSDSFL